MYQQRQMTINSVNPNTSSLFLFLPRPQMLSFQKICKAQKIKMRVRENFETWSKENRIIAMIFQSPNWYSLQIFFYKGYVFCNLFMFLIWFNRRWEFECIIRLIMIVINSVIEESRSTNFCNPTSSAIIYVNLTCIAV